MVEKLEALVNRLEAAVARQEALVAAGGAGGAAAGSSTGGCALAKQYAGAVKSLIDALRAKTTELGNQYVTDLTERYLQLVVMQGQTLTTMSRFQKPDNIQFLFKPIGEALQTVEAVGKDRKSPINMVKVVGDSVNLLQYPAFEETKALIDNVNEFFDMIPFNGNKILKADKAPEVAWYQALQALNTAIKEFLLENFDKVNKWYGQEDCSGAEAYFTGATTPDLLNDFSSLEGGSGGAAPPKSAAKPAATGGAGEAIGNEYAAAIKAELDTFVAKGSAFENDTVKSAVQKHQKAFAIQVALLKAMGSFKRPADITFATTASPIVPWIQETDESIRKDRKSPMDLMKVFVDAFQGYFWNTTPGNDMLDEYIDEVKNQVLFNGNRIRTKGKDAEKEVFEAFFALLEKHISFIKERKEYICDWRGKQDGAGAAAFLTSQSGDSATASTPAASGAAKPTPAPEEVKKAAPAKPAAKAGPKPKVPVRERRMNKWVVENFTNETITFGEDDVDKTTSFDFFNCNGCTIDFVGKCMSISMQSCKNTTMKVDRVISQVEVFKC